MVVCVAIHGNNGTCSTQLCGVKADDNDALHVTFSTFFLKQSKLLYANILLSLGNIEQLIDLCLF